jgi:hypothetical protein
LMYTWFANFDNTCRVKSTRSYLAKKITVVYYYHTYSLCTRAPFLHLHAKVKLNFAPVDYRHN